MKQLIILVLLFCTYVAYGQDLIVTTTGDSLHCKIIEVTSDQIQFRFGPGRIIPIKRSEVTSYKYNFAPIEADNQKPRRQDDATTPKSENSEKATDETTSFFVAINGGVSTYGSVSFGEIDSGGAASFGADVAYFFTSWLGAGLKVNALNCKVDLSEKYTYNDLVMFYGPALYGRFGKNKFAVAACAAVCGINWKMTKQISNGQSLDDKSFTSVGALLSVGVNYRLTRNLGLGLNVQSPLGIVKDKDVENFERKLTGIGCTLGIHFNF